MGDEFDPGAVIEVLKKNPEFAARLNDQAKANPAIAGYLKSVAPQTYPGTAPSDEQMMQMPFSERLGAFLKHTAYSGALPLAGGMAGGLALGLPTGGALAIPGEMLGAAGGELANQLFGFTAPNSPGQMAMAGASPLTGRMLKGGGQEAAKRLPGAPGVLQEQAIEGMRGMAARAAPAAGASDAAYTAVRAAGNVPVSTSSLDSTVQNIVGQTGQLVPSLRSSKLESLLSDLSGMRQRQPTFNDYWENVKAVGRLQRQAEQTGAPEAGAYKQLFKAMREDLERVPPATGGAPVPADLLKQANLLKQKEWAAEGLSDAVENAVRTVGDRGLQQGNFNKVLDFVRKDADFKGAFSAAERADMESLLKTLARTPKLPPPANTNFGSGQRIASYGLLTGAGGMLGGAEGAATSAAALGAYQKFGAPVIAKALMTDTGRKVLRNILESGAPLDAPRLAALAIVTGASTAQPGPNAP